MKRVFSLIGSFLVLNLLISGASELAHSPSKQTTARVTRGVPRGKRSENPCQGAVENMTVPTESGLILCMVPTDKDLTRKLKDIGSFNKHYVAVTEEEANDFENLLPSESAKKEIMPFPIIWSQRKDAFLSLFLGNWIRRSDETTNRNSKSETQASEADDNIVNSVKTRCVTRGSRTERNMIRLCTECQRISELSFDRFPCYINEITCENEAFDLQSRESLFCERNQGLCFQRYLLIDLLVRTDNYAEVTSPDQDKFFKAYEQIWEPYTQRIRSCCECQLFE